MALYRVTRRYSSSSFMAAEGDVVELDDALAAWLEGDSPGVLEPAVAETRAVESPPADRMVKAAATRESAKAVKS